MIKKCFPFGQKIVEQVEKKHSKNKPEEKPISSDHFYIIPGLVIIVFAQGDIKPEILIIDPAIFNEYIIFSG